MVRRFDISVRNRASRWRKSTPYRKKLIEVALPLEVINAASAKEKSIRHGHPSTLHLWWSRKPLATCRAVLFASLVDDPSSRPEKFPTEEAQEVERQRLFRIIERLVPWENINNEHVLKEARQEILKSTNGHPPPVLDPFCGGGSIPLEAQRLGLEAHASDLNPVAVLITKALIEIPPKFAGAPPVNPEARKNIQKKLEGQDWPGASGLAEDVRYYGKWVRDEAEKRIGYLYPKAKLPDGSEATVIAWLWARTVKCPNPACRAIMPLVSKFWLSTKKGNLTWIEPTTYNSSKEVKFEIRKGHPDKDKIGSINAGTSFINDKGKKAKATFKCLFCDSGIANGEYIDKMANEGKLGVMPLAIVAKGKRNRLYMPFNSHHFAIATEHSINYIKNQKIDERIPKEPSRGTFASNAQGRVYGFKTFSDYFSSRQLISLVTFTDLIREVWDRVLQDAREMGLPDELGIVEGGRGARAYADAVATYLAFSIDRSADFWCSIATWSPQPKNELVSHAFTRQAIPMTWDFAEANPFSASGGSFQENLAFIIKVLNFAPANKTTAYAKQLDSTAYINEYPKSMISTDPPYFNNVGYADLSDFFYIWLRRSVGNIYKDLFSTLLVPKARELVATPYRFNGSHESAKRFFQEGLQKSFSLIRIAQRSEYPFTIYYAYKQSEEDEENAGRSSTGWDAMLEGVINAGHMITGTWPVRTERKGRSVSLNTNALASSIVLVCRPRPEDAPIGTRKEFIIALKRELPESLRQLQKGNIAPVDLAQAAIGPGMAIFSRYSKILEADGSPMRVRIALQLINQHLDEYLSEQEGEYDADTRWALSWFEQYGMNEGPFGDAETLSKAKNTSVEGMVQAGILKAGVGKARLLRREEMDSNWDPTTDRRLTVWEATQYLIRTLEIEGESGASNLQQRLGGYAQRARDLAYRLYSICERKGWTQEAVAYNTLVTVWPRLKELRLDDESQKSLSSFQ
jgi:putative DNA methylase